MKAASFPETEGLPAYLPTYLPTKLPDVISKTPVIFIRIIRSISNYSDLDRKQF